MAFHHVHWYHLKCIQYLCGCCLVTLHYLYCLTDAQRYSLYQCLIKLIEKLPKIPLFFLIFKPLWSVWKFSLAFKIVDVEPNQDHQRAQFRPQRKLQLPFLQLNLVLSFLKKKYTHILTLLSQDIFKFKLWCKVPIGENI